LHVESFVRTLVVEDINKFIKAGLLLQKVRSRRLGGFFLQSEMHASVTAILLGMPRLDSFNADSEAKPPNRQFA